MIKLAFTGDLCLWGVKHAPYESKIQAMERVSELLSAYDLAIVNLECSLSEKSITDIKMNIPLHLCPSLIELNNRGVYCLANNHVKDSGAEELNNMLAYLRQNGSDFIGAGENTIKACQPLIKVLDGLKIALLNVTDASHYAASAAEPGVAVLNHRKLIHQVKSLSLEVDAVIVVIHADLEFTNYPAPWRVRLSRKLSKYCKLVIHHHSHTLQGIEQQNGCLIAYSLGNFVFPAHESEYMQNRKGGVDEAIILIAGLERTKRGVEVSLQQTLVTRIGDWGFLKSVEQAFQDQVLQKLANYSEALKDSRLLRRCHSHRCQSELKALLKGTYYRLARGEVCQAWRFLSWHFKTDQHRNWLKGVISFGWW
jgi:hypothetical protein